MQDKITNYLSLFKADNIFSRKELMDAMKKCGIEQSEAAFKASLQRLLRTGKIFRVGRNAYCVADGKIKKYEPAYSELAGKVAEIITENHPFLDYTVMDFVQLNEFVNHQIAHNVIFVSVEDDLGDFVFDTLKMHYPGKVLLNPTVELYHQYWYDNMIVIGKFCITP